MKKLIATIVLFLFPFMTSATFVIDEPPPPHGGGGSVADRYWVGNGGNWNDTAHWSLTSGGASGASAPTSSLDVAIDSNSFSLGSQTITLNATGNVKSMDWTGVINSPTFDFTTRNLNVYGNFTLVSGMSITPGTGRLGLAASSGSWTITTAGKTLPKIQTLDAGTWTLQDNLTSDSQIYLSSGTLDTNGKYVTATDFNTSRIADARTLILGNSTLELSGTNGFWSSNAGVFTLTAGTSTIKTSIVDLPSPGSFTLNNVILTGTGENNVSGDLTFNTLEVQNPGATVTFFAGENYTVTNFVANGTNGNNITLQSTGGTWTITKTSGTVFCDYCTISDSTATGGATFRATNSIDGGGNSGWIFGPPLVPTTFRTPTTFKSSGGMVFRTPTTFR